MDEQRVEYTDILVANPKAKVSFRDLFCEYVRLKEEHKHELHFYFGNTDDRIHLIEQERPLVAEAYEKLGIDKVRELNYNVTNIKRAIINTQTNRSTDYKIMKCLKEAGITAGTTLSAKELKTLLQNIYASLGIKNACGKIKNAKATDLETWFEINRISPKIKGKTTDCIVIKREKIVFV
jgi:hypothetical protein